MNNVVVSFCVLAGAIHLLAAGVDASHSLRFYGTGSNDIDRIKIPLTDPNRPVNVGGDFTIEFWMRTTSGNNGTVTAAAHGNGWITGNVIVDRDIFGDGDHGDFGIAIGQSGSPASARKVAFGCDRGGTGRTIVGSRNVADGQWHHVAVTRHGSSGLMQIFVDGQLDATGTGPSGDVSYREGRATSWPESDPFLVLGAEKHDAGSAYPSFHGYLDELRISRVVRYTHDFIPPSNPFEPDEHTVGLYHFDEGSGTVAHDSSEATGGPSHGELRVGGSPAGPAWSTETPFHPAPPAFAFARQGVPLILKGEARTPNGVVPLVSTNWFTAPHNQLVMVVDWEASRVTLEEWNGALTHPVDRKPLVAGTQAVVFASRRVAMVFNARTNGVTVAADLETGEAGDADWDNDGHLDHVAGLALLGTLTVKPSGIISNRLSGATATGAVTRVQADLIGVLHDPVAASHGTPRILWRGQLRSRPDGAFLVDASP